MRILSFCPTHDSSVCVLNDGELEFFCKEERISRVKRDNNPFKSLELYASLDLGSVDHFVYATPSNHETEGRGFYFLYLKKRYGVKEVFSEYGHHLSHAMLAFVNSDFEEALVFVIDRDGSVIVHNNEPVARESESVFLFNKNHGIKNLYKSHWIMKDLDRKHLVHDYIQSLYPNCKVKARNPYSIVKVYEAATTLIGQHPLENGKTMGLSSYGEDLNYPPLFSDDIPLSDEFTTISTKKSADQVCFVNEHNLITNEVDEDNYQHYANRAKQVQLQTQEQVLKLIDEYTRTTGIHNVCIVGGYGLNVVANNFYLKHLPHVSFYFEPVADDTGVPIGAAMIKHWEQTKQFAKKLKNNFYHYFDSSEELTVGVEADIHKVVSLIDSGKSVAIFEGNPEAGPRALGHRSILFDARNPNAKKIVNRIKKREWYRPFAGVILKSEFPNYFYNLGLEESPYMTINFDATEETKELVPGVIHVDGTCRVQTVSDGFLHDLLEAFHKKTKCPMLLNTSFNLAGEPLVQTKADAIKTFENSELDALFFVEEGKILTKSK